MSDRQIVQAGVEVGYIMTVFSDRSGQQRTRREFGPPNPNFLPVCGQEFGIEQATRHNRVMREAELVDRVASSTGLTPAEAARVVDDVVAWYNEPVDEYVRRRHAHHRLYGKRNAEIFALIADELSRRLVAAPSLSERQLRRIIYG
jgi:hypothetical protein